MSVDLDKFSRYFSDVPLPMWIYDVESLAFLAVNDAAVATYGWSREEFLSMTIEDIRPPQDVAQLRAAVAETEDGYTDGGAWRHLTKTGQLLRMRVVTHSSIVSGRRAAVVAMFEITSLAHAESRGEALLALGQLADDVPLERFLDGAIGLLASAVESGHAVIYVIADEDSSIEVLCSTEDAAPVFGAYPGGIASSDADSLLRCALRDCEPKVLNDRASLHRSIVALHPDLERLIIVPILRSGRVVAIAAAANKVGGYTSDDIDTVRILACLALRVVQRERALQETAEAIGRQQQTMWALIDALSKAAEFRDPYTAGHQRRVAALAAEIGRELGLADDELDGLYVAGSLHDLGKMAIPADILTKPTRLSDLEMGLVRTHAEFGADILSGVTFPWPIALVVRQHHERLDGTGYPLQLKGNEILFAARVIAVADVVEAMMSHRPYRPALDVSNALAEIRSGSGTRYDPDVVSACERVIKAQGGQLPEEVGWDDWTLFVSERE